MKINQLLICLAGILLVNAQAQTEPPRRPQPGGAFAGQQRPGASLVADPSLTDEQKQVIREAFEPDREPTIELYRKLGVARKGLQDASFAEKADPETIRAKGMEIGKIEGELALLRSKAVDRLRGKLSNEQIDRLKLSPMLGGGLTPGMGQGRPGAGDSAPRRPQAPDGQGKYGRPGGNQSDAPRRPTPPPPDEKP